MSNANIIKLEVGEFKILGKITKRNWPEVEVEIMSPYQGLKWLSPAIPLGMRQFKDYSGSDGDLKAIEMLSDLYRFCKYVDENLPKLKQTLQEYEEAVHYAGNVEPRVVKKKELTRELRGEMSELRKDLKAGKIDSKDYPPLFTPLKRKVKDLMFETEVDTLRVFEKSFAAYEHTPIFKVDYEVVLEYLTRLSKL